MKPNIKSAYTCASEGWPNEMQFSKGQRFFCWKVTNSSVGKDYDRAPFEIWSLTFLPTTPFDGRCCHDWLSKSWNPRVNSRSNAISPWNRHPTPKKISQIFPFLFKICRKWRKIMLLFLQESKILPRTRGKSMLVKAQQDVAASWVGHPILWKDPTWERNLLRNVRRTKENVKSRKSICNTNNLWNYQWFFRVADHSKETTLLGLA